jgi:hypothetical protein
MQNAHNQIPFSNSSHCSASWERRPWPRVVVTNYLRSKGGLNAPEIDDVYRAERRRGDGRICANTEFTEFAQ